MRSPRSQIGNAEFAASDGFTLIEVLIALTILSVSLALLLAIFSQGLERAKESENEATARTLAQSLLTQAENATNPALGSTSGRNGELNWNLRIAPYGSGDDRAAWQNDPAQIFATVSWRGYGRTRSISLTSLRLVPKAPAE
jgi:general secretion pathway protein I